MSLRHSELSVTMPLVKAGYGPIVSVGATTQDGALIKQLPELVDELEELEVDEDELLDDDEDEVAVLEEALLLELLSLPPPQPTSVSAPKVPSACRREMILSL